MLKVIAAVLCIHFFAFTLHSQILLYPLDQNEVLLHREKSSERNIPINFEIYLLKGQTTRLCFPNIGFTTFDTLINRECQPISQSKATIEISCVKIESNPDAEVSSETICLRYYADSQNFKDLTVKIHIVKSKNLPFFDDFSNSAHDPDIEKWTDKNVFINNTMAFQPPTIGVASFDGLNSNGTPYGGNYGRSDELTSTYLNTSSLSDSTFLIFFAQAKGNTFFHELKDSILLEFKNKNGDWVKQLSIKGIGPEQSQNYIPPFTKYAAWLSPDYQYDGFQFRFTNFGYRKGIYSTWHLDYILLKDAFKSKEPLNDVAFTDLPSNLFYPYSRIPIQQLSSLNAASINPLSYIGIFNHFNSVQNSGIGTYSLKEQYQNKDLYASNGLFNADPSQLNFQIGQSYFQNELPINDLFNAMISARNNDNPLLFETIYKIKPNAGPILGDTSNNVVKRYNEVNFSLAYDDGTPELNIAAGATNQVKTQVAVKFHIEQPDTLKAISMHIPRLVNDISGQLFNLKVWIGELDDEPEYQYLLQRPIYTDLYFDTLNGFTTYPLVNDLTLTPTPLFIPKGDFYIGWQQFTLSDLQQFIPIGLDRNFPQGDEFTYYKSSGNWTKLSELSPGKFKGVPMIRGIFKNSKITSPISTNSLNKTLRCYPNPVSDILSIDYTQTIDAKSIIKIYDSYGKCVTTSTFKSQINLKSLPPGNYLLQLIGEKNEMISSQIIIKVDR